jgi:hypothetical protein
MKQQIEELNMNTLTQKLFTHVHTGAIDTQEGWVASYDSEELEQRGLTAEQAFDEDESTTLLETTESK